MTQDTMTVLEGLDLLNDDEVEAVIARSHELLAQRDKERKADAMKQIQALAKATGLSVGKKAKKRK